MMGIAKTVRVALLTLVMLLIPLYVAAADSTWTVYDAANSMLPTDFVSSISFDNCGRQFIGTDGGGLVVRSDSTWRIFNQSNTGAPIDVVRLAELDCDGNLWLAAASGNLDISPYGFGVARLDPADSTWAMHNGGLEVNQVVTGIIIDGDNRYVSTYGGGITIYSDTGWIRYRHRSRTEYSYADSQQQTFEVSPGTYIPSDYIRALDIDRIRGGIWIATANGGAVKYHSGEWTKFNTANSGLPSNQVLSLRADPYNANIYFGTAAGLGILNDSVWTVYNPGNSPLPDGLISTIEVRPGNGEIWMGTGFGVWVLQTDGGWRGYVAPDGNFISGEFYSDISFDSSEAVWVSAYGGGMASSSFAVPPPPPPADTLIVDVERLRIVFHRHHPLNRLYALMNIQNAPALVSDDTVALLLTTDSGELYRFDLQFGEFRRGHWHFRDMTVYGYLHDRLCVILGISDSDPGDVQVLITDLDADMNRDNFADILTVTFRLGARTGQQVVNLRHSRLADAPNPATGPDIDPIDSYEIYEPLPGAGRQATPPIDYVSILNYPNPFNSQTTIAFDLPQSTDVRLDVYDVLGRSVSRLQAGYMSAGRHEFIWPPASGRSDELNSGVYYYRLSTGNGALTGKMLYLK